MSLLDRGTTRVVVFPEEMVIDEDGNYKTRPSKNGIDCAAVIQPANSSIQPPGAGESRDIGFQSSELLRLRLVGWPHGELGEQAQIEWCGKRYAIQGEPKRYFTSRMTAHSDYTLQRK